MQHAELTFLPQNTVPVAGSEARQVLALMSALEDHEDVQNAYANFDIPDEILAEVGDQDHWTLCELALASVGQERGRVESVMSKAFGFIAADRNLEVLDQRMEIL